MKKTTIKQLLFIFALLLGGASSAWADPTVIYQKGTTGYAWATTDFDGTSEGSWTGDVSAASISAGDPKGLKISSNSEGKSISKTITYSSNHLLIYDIVWQIGYASQASASNIAKLTIGDVVEFQYWTRAADLYAKVIIAGTTYNIPKYYSNNDNWTIHAEIDTYNKKLVALTVAGLKQKETNVATDESAFNYNLTDLTTYYSTIALASNASFSSLALSFGWGKGTVYTQIESVVVSETPLYAYGINWKSGDTDMGVFKSGYDVKDATIASMPYYGYMLKDNTLYKKSTICGSTDAFILSLNGQTEYVTGYSAQSGCFVYLKEAEDVEGMTIGSMNKMDQRCSGKKGAYFTSDVTLTTLPAGTYKIYSAFQGEGTSTFTFKAAGVSKWSYEHSKTNSYHNPQNSEEFTLTASSEITIKGGSSSVGVDYIYIEQTAVNVSNVDALGYTFSSPYALNFTGKKVEAYTAAYNSTTKKVKLSRVYKVPANTGLFIKGTADDIPVLTGDADAMGTNNLIAVSATTTVNQTEDDNTNFVLGVDNASAPTAAVFLKAPSGGVSVSAGKAYLQIPTASVPTARMAVVFEDEATGISDATHLNENGKMTNANYYDLSGRRVAQPTKGLYIVNGKKVVIK